MDSRFVLSFSPLKLLLWNWGSGRDEEPAGECPSPDSDPFSEAEFEKLPTICQDKM
jgi:hypothetical protein